MADQKLILKCEADTASVASDLAIAAEPGDLITLRGDLGAGKTSFARAFIRQYLGHADIEVPSPTYLVSIDYENAAAQAVTHMDLYRIGDPSELDELDLDEALERGVVLVEWPQKAAGTLPTADLAITINITGQDNRELVIAANCDAKTRFARSLAIGGFLREAWPGEVQRQPFAADASARNYELITNGDTRRLLMDAPKTPDGPQIQQGKTYSQIAKLAEEVKPFVAIANLLRDNGLNAPEIFASDLDNGLVLLEHLGDGKITDRHNAPIPERYITSARLLAKMHSSNWPIKIPVKDATPYTLPEFDRSAMMIEVDLLVQWYLQSDREYSASENDISEYNTIWETLCKKAQVFEKSIVLRDFHSPNIIWCESDNLAKCVGLIDFQDALLGPAAYDLVSLAQDARIVVSGSLEEEIVREYIAARHINDPDFDETGFRFEYAVMGAQRASKILGIFVRLHLRDNKPQYLRLIPVIRDYLKRNLQHPGLSDYRQWCERVINL